MNLNPYDPLEYYWIQVRTEDLTEEQIDAYNKSTSDPLIPIREYVSFSINQEEQKVHLQYTTGIAETDINISTEQFMQLMKYFCIDRHATYLMLIDIVKEHTNEIQTR